MLCILAVKINIIILDKYIGNNGDAILNITLILSIHENNVFRITKFHNTPL